MRTAWLSLSPSTRPIRLEPGLNGAYGNKEHDQGNEKAQSKRVRDSECERPSNLLEERRTTANNLLQHSVYASMTELGRVAL